jgi:hypothetical protein
VLFQDEYVSVSCCNHTGRWRRPREAQPIGCEIQFWHDAAKDTHGRTAAAERLRTARRTTSNDSGDWDVYSARGHSESGKRLSLKNMQAMQRSRQSRGTRQ